MLRSLRVRGSRTGLRPVAALWMRLGGMRSLSAPQYPLRPCSNASESSRRCVKLNSIDTEGSTAVSVVEREQKATPKAPTFQEAIQRLQEYWASVGCLVLMPHNSEVGAGTMNPATFLRVLGPEPWEVCYPEPSVRPDDSRYGTNPNRVQRHTQFQVILKPDPGNSQELYLGSLEALGVNTCRHDLRFVEDNWESPALGAWGLGWEVWLDGMEITQFTYFQQAGGRSLPNPAVEITYGLERILMSLQGVSHFRDIRYNDSVMYGELFLQNEYEMSRYNLDSANIEEQRQRFALYEREATQMIEEELPIPAYNNILKLSHTFNVLDARGAVGVTERANNFATMRGLCRRVSELWLKRREQLEYPLGVVPEQQPLESLPPSSTNGSGAARDFVLEVGSEELPPDEVSSCVEQLRARVPAMLEELRLQHQGVVVEGTPRRLSVQVKALQAAQAEERAEVRGPPAKVAMDGEGEPTKALLGFCRKNGVAAEDVVVKPDASGTDYIWALRVDEGRPAAEVMTEQLPKLLAGISFRKTMRWQGSTGWSRPLRWLLAMHGDTALQFAFADLRAGATTRLLRNANLKDLQLDSAEEYASALEQATIQLGIQDRKDAIWERACSLAAEVGGEVPAGNREGGLLDEVANLVESPTPILGSFSTDFLQLPSEVLVMVMRKHQRYFPVVKPGSDGAQQPPELLPHFVTVANGAVDVDVVRAGNEAVLRARFEDASFFYQEDLKKPLEDFLPGLSGTMFQKDLGSMLDKAQRTERLVPVIAALTGLDDALEVALQAAHLAKADLATNVVMEMTSLAGTMGRHYALKEGQPQAVADAIFEAALPRSAGDLLPHTPAGVLVSICDRLDSLVGLLAAGNAPTATADPFGLRRSAYGMLQALLASEVRLDLRKAVAASAALQPLQVGDDALEEVLSFVRRRLEQALVDSGICAEVVRAVLNERGNDAFLAKSSASELQDMLDGQGKELLSSVMEAYARPTRIVRGKEVPEVSTLDTSLFECDEEHNLFAAYQQVTSQVEDGMRLEAFLQLSWQLVEPIGAFFENVFVMCDDEAVRRNRLALVRAVAELPSGVVDFAELPGF